MERNKASFIDYLSILVKWRKFIIINFFIIAFITAAISLIMPKTYTAKTTILPPTEESSGLGLSQLMGKLPLGQLGIMGGVSEETYVFIAIINSRTIMEAVVEKFGLIKLYEVENMEEAVRSLRGNINVEINEDATISLYAIAKTGYFANDEEEDGARTLARDIANMFIQKLDSINLRIKTEKAKNTRIYIEKRYLQNIADIKKAEREMREFQEGHGVIALPEQTAAAITAAADMQAQVMMKEIEIAVLSKSFSSSHGDLVAAKNQLQELKRKLNEMNSGVPNESTDDNNNSNLFIPFSKVPELGVEYVRLFREITIQEKLLEFLLPQYEQAKIQEAKDTPTVQILDKAVKPILRTKPKRAIMVILAGMLSIVFSMVIAFLIEYIRNLKSNEDSDYYKLEEMIYSIRNDVRRFIPRKFKNNRKLIE